MLARVLLHVIEAAVPIHVAAHAAVLFELAIDEVAYGAVFLIEDVDPILLRERSEIRAEAGEVRV